MSPADSTTSRNSTLSAPSHHGARTTAVHERDMVEFIKSMTPQKEPRDPRADPEQWPCHGNHIPGKGHSNAHGEWTHCAVCNYRLKYVPKKGSNSANTKVENAEMVRRMLTELQSLMRGCRPTAAICSAMQQKVNAEAAVMDLIHSEIDRQKKQMATQGYVKGKATTSKDFSDGNTSFTVNILKLGSGDSGNQSITSGSRDGGTPDPRGKGSAQGTSAQTAPAKLSSRHTGSSSGRRGAGLRGRDELKEKTMPLTHFMA